MLAIESLRRRSRDLWGLPVLIRIGLAVMVVAGVADVVVHQVHGHGPIEHAAHLLGLVGMVLILAGVVTTGARRELSRRSGSSGGTRNAHR
jgi:peptidoglycan/LPS O-acetylase OafA/YrhL